MVRLVFRPHAHVRRSICTSEPLRASTRVSSGFALRRHSSPSFGSDQPRSYSNPSVKPLDRSTVRPRAPASVHFHCALGFCARALAWVFDSLVRVSRRVAGGHYASILAYSAFLGPHRAIKQGSIRSPRGEPRFPCPSGPAASRCWPGQRRSAPVRENRMIHRARVWPQTLPLQQFHVLFDPLSKVLFIFRSLYLCAIGLWPVFSFRRNVPPA